MRPCIPEQPGELGVKVATGASRNEAARIIDGKRDPVWKFGGEVIERLGETHNPGQNRNSFSP
jgi:hypothetical protein